jgi:tRNA(Ile)-lysidine synthase TilS/MesJ
MSGNPDIIRPLIHKTKQELIDYANEHKLKWIDDSTNDDEKYLRNYVRKNIMPKLEPARETLVEINNKINRTYHEIDMRFSYILPKSNVLLRSRFSLLPYILQREFMYQWLTKNGVPDLTSSTIERLVTSVKTMQIGKKTDVNGILWLVSEKENVLLTSKKSI